MSLIATTRLRLLVLYCGALAGFLVLSGCDTVENDSITISKDVSFRFEFSTAGTEAGEQIEVASVERIDIDDLLVAEGITKGEILLANVRSVELQRVTPVGTNLDAFERVAFSLTAEGLTVPIVAEADALPAGREAELEVRFPGVSEVLWQPTFGGRLVAVPASSEGEQYVLSVTMQVVIEAEGV